MHSTCLTSIACFRLEPAGWRSDIWVWRSVAVGQLAFWKLQCMGLVQHWSSTNQTYVDDQSPSKIIVGVPFCVLEGVRGH